MAKIVVGVDGSEDSKNAFRWAVEEARLRGAPVVALLAWETSLPPPDLTPAPPPDFAGFVSELQDRALDSVAAVVREVVGEDATVTVEPAAVEGPPASVLIEAARDADLLVVGSRGHGGFAGLLLGSVSQQLAQHAPCPLVIHRAGSG
jgi:nucleotide-binding universal stress UspA family protein